MSKKLPKCNSALTHMKKQVVQQIKRYPQYLGTKPWDYFIAGKDISYQVGSLMKLMMQLEGERYQHGKTDKELIKDIADELADILSLILFISHELDIDLDDAWNTMLKSDEEKFKNRNITGNSIT